MHRPSRFVTVSHFCQQLTSNDKATLGERLRRAKRYRPSNPG